MSILIFVLLIGLACEQEVKLALPTHHPRFVVYGFISPHHTFSMYLGRSRGVLEPLQSDEWNQSVSDAQVNIYKDDQPMGMLTYQNSITLLDTFYQQIGTFTDTFFLARYASGYFWQQPYTLADAGAHYTLNIQHSEFPRITASSNFPEAISLDSVVLEVAGVRDVEGYQFYRLHIYFDDPPPTQNYYALNCTAFKQLSKDADLWESYTLPVFKETDVQTGNWAPVVGFSDQEEKLNQLPLTFAVESISNIADQAIAPDSFEVELLTTDEHYFKFYQSLQKHEQYQDFQLGVLAAEPIPVYSNIEGGMGIFASYNSSKQVARIE